jgi:hypothetical protein
MEAIEDVAHAWGIENICHEREDNAAIATFDEFLLDGEDLNFGLFDEEETLGVEGSDLAAEFGADAAAAAGDHDDAIFEEGSDAERFEFDGIAAEEILNFDVAELADLDLAGGELVHGGDRFEAETGLLEELDEFTNAAGGSGGHGDNNFLELEVEAAVEEGFGRADDWDVVDAGAPFLFVIIKESNGLKAEAAFGHELAGEACADIASAEDADAAAAALGLGLGGEVAFTENAEQDANDGDADEGKDKIRQEHTPGHGKEAGIGVADGQENAGRNDAGEEEAAEVRDAEVTEETGELAEEEKDSEFEGNDPNAVSVELKDEFRRQAEIEAQEVGKIKRNKQDDGVEGDQEDRSKRS